VTSNGTLWFIAVNVFVFLDELTACLAAPLSEAKRRFLATRDRIWARRNPARLRRARGPGGPHACGGGHTMMPWALLTHLISYWRYPEMRCITLFDHSRVLLRQDPSELS
jgi:hypothetical protein